MSNINSLSLEISNNTRRNGSGLVCRVIKQLNGQLIGWVIHAGNVAQKPLYHILFIVNGEL